MVLWTPGFPSLGLGCPGEAGRHGYRCYPKPFLYDGSLSLTAVSLLYKVPPVKVIRTERTLFTVTVGFAAEIENPSWERHEMLSSLDAQCDLLSALWWRQATSESCGLL